MIIHNMQVKQKNNKALASGTNIIAWLRSLNFHPDSGSSKILVWYVKISLDRHKQQMQNDLHVADIQPKSNLIRGN